MLLLSFAAIAGPCSVITERHKNQQKSRLKKPATSGNDLQPTLRSAWGINLDCGIAVRDLRGMACRAIGRRQVLEVAKWCVALRVTGKLYVNREEAGVFPTQTMRSVWFYVVLFVGTLCCNALRCGF